MPIDITKVQDELCGLPSESKSQGLLAHTGTTFSIVFLLAVLRIIGKVVAKRLTFDDWIIMTSLLLSAVAVGCTFRSTASLNTLHIITE